MVQINALWLTFAYVAAALLLLAILVTLPWPRGVKIGAILLTSALYAVVFFATQGLLGWSAPVAVPDRFQLLWARVVEPDASHKQAGAIHLWVEELDESNLPSGVPRAFRLPYTPALAQRVATAQSEIRKGHPQGGRSVGLGIGELPPDESQFNPQNARMPAGGDPPRGGLLDPAFLGGQSRSVELIPLPPPSLPPKGDPM